MYSALESFLPEIFIFKIIWICLSNRKPRLNNIIGIPLEEMSSLKLKNLNGKEKLSFYLSFLLLKGAEIIHLL